MCQKDREWVCLRSVLNFKFHFLYSKFQFFSCTIVKFGFREEVSLLNLRTTIIFMNILQYFFTTKFIKHCFIVSSYVYSDHQFICHSSCLSISGLRVRQEFFTMNENREPVHLAHAHWLLETLDLGSCQEIQKHCAPLFESCDFNIPIFLTWTQF